MSLKTAASLIHKKTRLLGDGSMNDKRRRSGVVVHRELVGMRALTQLLNLFVFEVDPVVDEIVAEHTACGQEAPIGIERFKGTIQ